MGRRRLRKRYGRSRPFIRSNRNASRLVEVEKQLIAAMDSADARGYSGMVGSKGSLFDDPKIKSLLRKRDALLHARGGEYNP
jgi:hypothetical protein